MDIIPVLDLMGGRVVLGRAGERSRYRPVKSVLVDGSEPLAVATALHRVTACPALYLADLDAIQGAGDHLQTIRDLTGRVHAGLWVDAGITHQEAAVRVLTAGASRAVVGTETLPSVAAFHELRAAVPAERLLLSIDVGATGVLSACPELRGRDPVAAAEILAASTMPHLLVLTLDRVGMAAGPDLTLLRALRQAYPHLALVAAGGVRDADDLRLLASAGVDAVLVATALHCGWITARDLAGIADAH